MANQTNTRAVMLQEQARNRAMSGDYEGAINLFSQALSLAPNDGRIYHDRGMTHSRFQRWTQALADLDRAIALSPHPASYEERASIYFAMGNKQAARQDLERALRIDSFSPIALMNLGYLYIEDGKYDRAIEYLTKAINVEPTMANAYANRARAHYKKGNLDRAYSDAEKAKELIESGRDTTDATTYDT
jgi:tetratricopeptide (TPR) repeat protein